jgi:hypothetical protein
MKNLLTLTLSALTNRTWNLRDGYYWPSLLIDQRLLRVWSAECGARSVECGARSAECGVRSAECGVRSAERGVWNAERGASGTPADDVYHRERPTQTCHQPVGNQTKCLGATHTLHTLLILPSPTSPPSPIFADRPALQPSVNLSVGSCANVMGHERGEVRLQRVERQKVLARVDASDVRRRRQPHKAYLLRA